MSAKKKEDDKAVFDGGGFGIGHNQGPPLDDREAIAAEAEAKTDDSADTETQPLRRGRKSGSTLTKEALAWMRAKEKSGELEKVTWDSPYGSDVIKNHEMRMAGPSRPDPSSPGVNAKWRNPDGLTSRRGYRRIIPAHLDGDGFENELWADNAEQLAELANKKLRGRYATVFEALVIKPLLAGRRRTTEELQQQARKFNVLEDRIYRILHKCWQRINRAADELKVNPVEPMLSEEERSRRERQYERARLELRADLAEMWRQERAIDMEERVSFHTAIKRCPSIKRLFVEAHKPPEHIVPRSDLIGATVVHYYGDECACIGFKLLLDELRRLVGPAADTQDPVLASKATLRVVANRLVRAYRRRCISKCPECSGVGPALPNDL